MDVEITIQVSTLGLHVRLRSGFVLHDNGKTIPDPSLFPQEIPHNMFNQNPPKSKIQDSKSIGCKIQNPRSKNQKSKIQNPNSKRVCPTRVSAHPSAQQLCPQRLKHLKPSPFTIHVDEKIGLFAPCFVYFFVIFFLSSKLQCFTWNFGSWPISPKTHDNHRLKFVSTVSKMSSCKSPKEFAKFGS